MSASRHLFYNGKSLATIKADGSHTRLIHANDIPLCQVNSNQKNAYLLLINEAKSILAAHQLDESRNIAYSAYGGQPADNLNIKLGYNGELRDTFDLYLLGKGTRAYSPSIRRFSSPDRIGIFFPGNFNSYAYTACDPINRIDPSGNIWQQLKTGLRTIGVMGPKGTKNYKLDKANLRSKLKELKITEQRMSVAKEERTGLKEIRKNLHQELGKVQERLKAIDSSTTQARPEVNIHKNEAEYLTRKRNDILTSINSNREARKPIREDLKILADAHENILENIATLEGKIDAFKKANEIRRA